MNESHHVFTTDAGLQVRVRPLYPDDAPFLIDIFAHLGVESRYLRFHRAFSSLPTHQIVGEATAIAQTTWRHGRGWLAFADLPNEPDAAVGGVRWVRTHGDEAEIALTVRDDMQGQGIGRELLRIAVEQARADGIHTLTAVVQANNRAIQRLLGASPWPVQRSIHAGEMFIAVDLRGAESYALA
ncbi:MAG: GNAT family N-acetyltransferase [Caldilineales bacterium]|nr:GNAT family N-acetyltransferase [Caldilineales bacterium]